MVCKAVLEIYKALQKAISSKIFFAYRIKLLISSGLLMIIRYGLFCFFPHLKC